MICHPVIEFQVERYHERIVSVKPDCGTMTLSR